MPEGIDITRGVSPMGGLGVGWVPPEIFADHREFDLIHNNNNVKCGTSFI
jgi:hypothetical protein